MYEHLTETALCVEVSLASKLVDSIKLEPRLAEQIEEVDLYF